MTRAKAALPNRRVRSVTWPIVIGTGLIVVTIALTVGWYVLIVRDAERISRVASEFRGSFSPLHWFFVVLGGVFFALIITGLVFAIVLLAREIRLNQSQQNFIDAVTHELKTPLASIRLYLDTMTLRDVPAGKRAEFFQIMNKELQRLDSTINHVLEAAAAGKPMDRAHFVPVHVNAIVLEAIAAINRKYRLPEGAIAFTEAASAFVLGERVAMEMVFTNLLDNAVKYSDGPVQVNVRVAAMGNGHMRATISDRGAGIKSEELKRIFDRFYRARNEATERRSGTGLGLYLVRSIVTNLGGRIEAASPGPGQGATFTVEFPMLEAA